MGTNPPEWANSKRCPACAALNDAAAEWCGQCMAKFPQARPLDYETAVRRALRAGEAAEKAARSGSPSGSSSAEAAPANPAAAAAATDSPQPPTGSGLLPKLGLTANLGLLPFETGDDDSFSMAFKVQSGALTWSCSSCGNENPIQDHTCSLCNTPFKKAARHFADKATSRRQARTAVGTAGALAALSPAGWSVLPLRLLFVGLSFLARLIFRPRQH